MRVAQINGGVFGSTGKIMFGIAETAKENGIETRCFSPVTTTNRNRQPAFEYEKIGGFWGRRISVFLSRLTGYDGCFSYFATKKLLKKLSKFQPDVIHLHNLHGSFIHLPSLFSYIKKRKIAVVWTLHDCWAFTGHCSHFTIMKCEPWKLHCSYCAQKDEYPKSYFDNAKKMHKLKKKWFLGVENMTLVTPSKWLADLVKQSFLKEYPVKVIYNGLDLNIFQPTKTNFKESLGIFDKKMLLGVAMPWTERKGLKDFLSLSKLLTEEYIIVLVGLNRQQIETLPYNIIGLERTTNVKELVDIYSAADVFINPSRDETMGMVTVEAIACGVPVVTYNETAVPERVNEENGFVVQSGDICGLFAAVEKIVKGVAFKEKCVRSTVLDLEQKKQYKKYIEEYKNLIER